jgi:ubiquinone biosynthesis protein
MMTMEGVALTLDPSVSIVSVAEPFGRRLMTERISFSKNREDITRGVQELASLARNLPRRIEAVLEKVEKGSISVEIEDRNKDIPQIQLELAANRLALALIVVAGVLGSVFLLGMDRGSAIFAAGVVSLILTIFLSFWIVIAIIRSA